MKPDMKLYICYCPDFLNEDELHILFNIPNHGACWSSIEVKPVPSWSAAISFARSLSSSEPNCTAVVARRADGPNHAKDLISDLNVSPAGYVIFLDGAVKHYKPSEMRV